MLYLFAFQDTFDIHEEDEDDDVNSTTALSLDNIYDATRRTSVASTTTIPGAIRTGVCASRPNKNNCDDDTVRIDMTPTDRLIGEFPVTSQSNWLNSIDLRSIVTLLTYIKIVVIWLEKMWKIAFNKYLEAIYKLSF